MVQLRDLHRSVRTMIGTGCVARRGVRRFPPGLA